MPVPFHVLLSCFCRLEVPDRVVYDVQQTWHPTYSCSSHGHRRQEQELGNPLCMRLEEEFLQWIRDRFRDYAAPESDFGRRLMSGEGNNVRGEVDVRNNATVVPPTIDLL
jgi:hypothetical protein